MELSVKKSMANCMYDLLPILDMMNQIKSGERTLHNIIELLAKDLNCQSIAIIEINPNTELLEIRNFHNLSWEFCKNFHKKIEGQVLLELIWKGQDIYIPDKNFATSYAEEFKLEKEYTSSYSVQLMANQKPLGILYTDSDKVDAFPTETRLYIQMYARLISMILFIERITQRMEKLDTKDEETGAIRYEHFYPRLNEMYTRSKRLSEQMSVLLIDVEKYSGIIKMYGLDAAKQMLKELVELIQNSLRQYDGICRFGADEFLVALPSTEGEIAHKVAKKINDMILKNTFSDKKLKINTFIGLANYPDNAASLDGLITAVRAAMFMAKRKKQDNKIIRIEEHFE